MQLTNLIAHLLLASGIALAVPSQLSERDAPSASRTVLRSFFGTLEPLYHPSGMFETVLSLFRPEHKNKQLLGKIDYAQYHATCRNDAHSIISDIQKGELKLLPNRDWPDEFSWKGGFYLTSNVLKAEAYARALLSERCRDKGGMVIIEFGWKSLQVPNDDRILVASTEGEAKKGSEFRNDQLLIGTVIKKDVVGGRPNTVPEQDSAFFEKVKSKLGAGSFQKFTDIQNVDFVQGYAELTDIQKEKIKDAVKNYPGLDPLTEPFEQVIVLTDAGMAMLDAEDTDILEVPVTARLFA